MKSAPMSDSLFDDLLPTKTIKTTPKPPLARQHMQKNCTCLNCQHFAGRARDRLATLFKQGKGYCDHPDHAWGIWNVVQDIERPTKPPCALFSPAPEEITKQRLAAIKKLRR